MKIRTKGVTILNAVTSIVLALAITSGSTIVNAGPVEREQAKRIHDRLTGVPPTAATLTAMEALIVAGNPVGAALYAMDPAQNSRAKYFYNVVLKNWITPWTNVDQTQFAPLNDYTATVIGMILNNDPFNQVISGDFIYTANRSAISSDLGINIAAYSKTDNNQYEQLENNNIDLSKYLVKTLQSDPTINMAGSSLNDSAGVITTRAAGEAFFKAGTNRRMLRFTLKNFMCRDLEDVKDITRVPDRIRQDVSRSPGGDSTIFLNSCIGCHSGMDPLASAYSYYEWTEDANGNNGQTVYSNGLFTQDKYHINRTNFEYGHITSNDNWINYWRAGPNAALDWDWARAQNPLPPLNPLDPYEKNYHGAKSLGIEIEGSHAFAKCQVEKVYKQVCLQSPINTHTSDLATITQNFRDGGYNMKQVFADVAALCMGN